ncbi:FliM/FliN family flagellar motor C-terminal domain-containing protein [Variovorax ginsengisoli]|uniref:FliM/FliN family flagellar motor C-terminal domain-containing protein n=1 Tax=Variovorax ginsengisoli TaxID=363844 RepID=A0ABT8SE37_9BURK|nr:FliM/FliN family flagellar motor C-terminal domain-containing protein [Variovorax ginsengisoli]MDN8618020.1 FliM/FliN family flagellar motor C-terminal domain-containing protein [Variovorax ginsengisoli]MDO1537190.1 FliM/FliN family flagellar motor C-terminal domain-containing protein [Variovorax ginsengisoli]
MTTVIRNAEPVPAGPSPLLSPEESIHKVRALRRWSAAQREAVRARFASMSRTWCEAWLSQRDGAALEGTVEVGEPDMAMTPLSEDQACWTFAPTTSAAARPPTGAASAAMLALAREMFGPDRTEAPLARHVVRVAWDDWMQRIAALPVDLATEPQSFTKAPSRRPDPWSGALCVSWSWCGGTWQIGLPYRAVAALLGPHEAMSPASPSRNGAPPKVALDRALERQAVGLRVTLTGTQLDLGQLQSLKVGDVIPLAHRLDAPARITVGDGARLCDGWLGQVDGRIAVEFASSPSIPPNNPLAKKEDR